MSYEVTLDQKPNTTRIMIPLDVPTALVNAGAVEQYAVKICGWQPTIKDENNQDIPNPFSAVNACAKRIQGFVMEDYKSLFIRSSQEQAGEIAIQQFNSFFQ
jgi:hypothetical protein